MEVAFIVNNKLKRGEGSLWHVYFSNSPQIIGCVWFLLFWMGTASRKGVFLALSDAWKRRRLRAASTEGKGTLRSEGRRQAVKSESVEKRRGIEGWRVERDESKFKWEATYQHAKANLSRCYSFPCYPSGGRIGCRVIRITFSSVST